MKIMKNLHKKTMKLSTDKYEENEKYFGKVPSRKKRPLYDSFYGQKYDHFLRFSMDKSEKMNKINN